MVILLTYAALLQLIHVSGRPVLLGVRSCGVLDRPHCKRSTCNCVLKVSGMCVLFASRERGQDLPLCLVSSPVYIPASSRKRSDVVGDQATPASSRFNGARSAAPTR